MEPLEELDQIVEDCLVALSRVAAIREATVTIQYLAADAVAYRTEIFVSVPSADFQIQACDRSAKASFSRAAAMLEKRMRGRAMQRARQVIDTRLH